MLFKKVRNRDEWTYGEKLDSGEGFHARAVKDADGRFRVDYESHNGYGKGAGGSFTSNSLEEANATLHRTISDRIPTMNYDTIPVEKFMPSSFFDSDGDIFCPNCMSYNWSRVSGSSVDTVVQCRDCGCRSLPWKGEVLMDEWDHSVFDRYREMTEKERARTFSKRGWVFAEGGKVYYPENLDSSRYNLLTNYKNPKDRSRILSFCRRRK